MYEDTHLRIEMTYLHGLTMKVTKLHARFYKVTRLDF